MPCFVRPPELPPTYRLTTAGYLACDSWPWAKKEKHRLVRNELECGTCRDSKDSWNYDLFFRQPNKRTLRSRAIIMTSSMLLWLVFMESTKKRYWQSNTTIHLKMACPMDCCCTYFRFDYRLGFKKIYRSSLSIHWFYRFLLEHFSHWDDH